MRYLSAIAAVVLMASAVLADVPCNGGSPDILKFVNWDFKVIDSDNTEVTMTVHNATDRDFKESDIKIRWGEWDQFFFRFKTPTKANSDTTFMNTFGMGAKDATMLKALTPTLCTRKTYDEAGNKTSYD